jgi:hypothetical protein
MRTIFLKLILPIAMAGFALPSFAASSQPNLTPAMSAKRAPNETFESRWQQIKALDLLNGRHIQGEEYNAEQTRTLPSHANINAIPVWKEHVTLQEVFKRIRDKRFLKDVYHPGFLRRASWLFPDDGCHVRAEISAQLLINSKFTPPAKIFIFGNLRAHTDNSPTGYVTWWFHVANAYRVDGQVMILDPSLEIHRPLTLAEWIIESGAPSNLSISVCSAGTYLPTDPCQTPPASSGSTAFSEQQPFLAQEWDRMAELGRNPRKVLGDQPPWLSQQQE